MYRFTLYIFGAAAVLAGLLIGTLNSDAVQLDLLWLQIEWPLGVIVVIGFSAGLLLGLAALYVIQVIPLKISLRRQKNQAAATSHELSTPDA